MPHADLSISFKVNLEDPSEEIKKTLATAGKALEGLLTKKYGIQMQAALKAANMQVTEGLEVTWLKY